MRSARSKGKKDPTYLEWIRSLPCTVCLLDAVVARTSSRGYGFCGTTAQSSPTEAAHTGPRGLSAKSDDRTAIPLCGHEHHREGKQSHHKLGKKFFEHHHIDRDALVAELNKQYDSIQQRRTA